MGRLTYLGPQRRRSTAIYRLAERGMLIGLNSNDEDDSYGTGTTWRAQPAHVVVPDENDASRRCTQRTHMCGESITEHGGQAASCDYSSSHEGRAALFDYAARRYHRLAELNKLQNSDHSHKEDDDELAPIPAYDGIISSRRRRDGSLACYLANPDAQFQSCRNLLSTFVLPTTDDELQLYPTATSATVPAHDLHSIDDAVGLQTSSYEN